MRWKHCRSSSAVFLLKPANEADVRNVLENLRYPPETAPVGIKIQCFGNFEIFVGGRPLSFKRSKSKELLAYLVDRNGATCTNGEMLAVLWEDKPTPPRCTATCAI